ncbi:MAG: TRAM domain-containing protein [Nitrospirae bacterium]|nr:TRAM domain-containing protein [Nitrospirota bacterium]
MALNVIRFIFILAGGGLSYLFFPTARVYAVSIGLGVTFFIIGLEIALRKISLKSMIVASFGLILGLIVANLIIYSFRSIPLPQTADVFLPVGLSLILGYLGAAIFLKKKDDFHMTPQFRFGQSEEEDKILDTSVIIDGRIADICETGFLEGDLIVPRFILQELQKIADSADSLRRNRGRRGLDILNLLEKNARVRVKINEIDFPEIRETDAKLVKLAKEINAKVLTNDFNLNKVAELEKVKVLNINELARALRPVVLPGEIMNIKVIKEGKESGQGVAYLDDGTMVVVDNGRSQVGRNAEVVVTTVLQTAAGRMIFTRLATGGSNRTNNNRSGKRNSH